MAATPASPIQRTTETPLHSRKRHHHSEPDTHTPAIATDHPSETSLSRDNTQPGLPAQTLSQIFTPSNGAEPRSHHDFFSRPRMRPLTSRSVSKFAGHQMRSHRTDRRIVPDNGRICLDTVLTLKISTQRQAHSRVNSTFRQRKINVNRARRHVEVQADFSNQPICELPLVQFTTVDIRQSRPHHRCRGDHSDSTGLGQATNAQRRTDKSNKTQIFDRLPRYACVTIAASSIIKPDFRAIA
ncbi:hypothetical protein MM1218R_03323 [Mycobacterium marinum]|nr:hypothetical protein MM1218R_03323 [Mycobacterium marinum]AXN50557.1 hypothetical protein CCUG20998_03153 [Mycobacterium marinum]RFZ03618.1 hypothetical protein DE4381_04455 [Mycobacterium marinum]RFZ22177.1 hypothetical protein DSM44344_03466 [Mycobacterium marinum]RFZ23108.1 hypothetical protein NCTC2275_05622 [Mycobacterium marinum]